MFVGLRQKLLLLALNTICAGQHGPPQILPPSGAYKQKRRPPAQTSVQRISLQSVTEEVKSKSDAAKPGLLELLATVRNSLPEPLRNKSSAELLERLVWEFQRLPVITNGPLFDNDGEGPTERDDSGYWAPDTTNLNTTMKNRFLQNVCHQWLLWQFDKKKLSFDYERTFMVNYLKLPPFQDTYDLTLRESNNCVHYLALNMWKLNIGNLEYGDVTYVFNTKAPSYANKSALSPFDSGVFLALKHRQPHFGTPDDFFHLLQPYLDTLGFDLADILKHWWVPGSGAPENVTHCRVSASSDESGKHQNCSYLPHEECTQCFNYFEVEFFGNPWFPETVLYIILPFDRLFACGVLSYFENPPTSWNYSKCYGIYHNGFLANFPRPVVWALDGTSGMLIDPLVGNLAGNKITGTDAGHWQRFLWQTLSQYREPLSINSSQAWAQLYEEVQPHLRFTYLDYGQRLTCQDAEESPNNMIMGVDGDNKCVYWKAVAHTMRWECLNDGSCELSISGSFSTQSSCEEACGKGRWACIRTVQGSSLDRISSHSCMPDPTGDCPSRSYCESQCLQGVDACKAPAFQPVAGYLKDMSTGKYLSCSPNVSLADARSQMFRREAGYNSYRFRLLNKDGSESNACLNEVYPPGSERYAGDESLVKLASCGSWGSTGWNQVTPLLMADDDQNCVRINGTSVTTGICNHGFALIAFETPAVVPVLSLALVTCAVVFLSASTFCVFSRFVHHQRCYDSVAQSFSFQQDGPHWFVLIGFGLALYDIGVSAKYVYWLWRQQYTWCAVFYTVVLIGSFLSGLLSILALLHAEAKNPAVRQWLRSTSVPVACVLLISASNLPAIQILTAQIPHLKFTQAPLSLDKLKALCIVAASVENVPKFLAQTVILTSINLISMDMILSLTSVAVDIVFLTVVGTLHVFIVWGATAEDSRSVDARVLRTIE